jgi:queuine tRNA-ribosyltransferase
MSFNLRKNARRKKIKTKSGEIESPFFMPDATRGFVKSLSGEDLLSAGIDPMVVNTYHLFLQPGVELIKASGGVHNFMHWNRPLLSDSGGYQVFSLIHKNPQMGKITDDGVEFRSPLDGSKHYITPEKAIQIQFDLGVDMMVCLDDPPPNSYSEEQIEAAVNRTLAWAKRCKKEYEKQIKIRKISKKDQPIIFGVIQGGEYLDLRKKCTEGLVKIGFGGYGFGARHIDSGGNFLGEVLEYTAKLIPEDSLRFALGIGTPEDIVRCVSFGWDMFDCVIPTREARHGRIFLWKSNDLSGDFYETANISNSKFKNDFSSISEDCSCELCRNHSRSYLHHIFKMKDPLAMRLISIHNLKFYTDLMNKIKKELPEMTNS